MAASPKLPHSPAPRQISKHGVLVLHGFGIKVRLHNSHFLADWGVGLDRYQVRLSRVDGHKLKRVILLGSDGYIYIQDTAILWGSAWTQSAIWGSDKGRADGISMTPVPVSIVSSNGAIWGGNGGARSIVDNSQVTADGAIWGGARSSVTSTTGTVNNEGAIWTNPRK